MREYTTFSRSQGKVVGSCDDPERFHAHSDTELDLDLRWWDAANYLTVGQIYLGDNALLREPLTAAHI